MGWKVDVRYWWGLIRCPTIRSPCVHPAPYTASLKCAWRDLLLTRLAGSSRVIDIVDAKTRSRMMASIRGKNTAPERILRSALHRLGHRFRLHGKGLPGRPDIVFSRYRAVIFVHGCFWHRHANCRLAYIPKSRSEFWIGKFSATVQRDQAQISGLREAGWRVAVVWECALRKKGAATVASELSEWLSGPEYEIEIAEPGG